MEFRIVLALLFFGQLVQLTTAREKPELTFGVNVDKIGVGTRFRESLGILEPTVKWTHGGRVLGCDYAVSTNLCFLLAFLINASPPNEEPMIAIDTGRCRRQGRVWWKRFTIHSFCSH